MQDVRHIKVVAEDDGQRLDRWLKKRVPELPWGLAQKLIRKGAIRVDSKRAKTETRLEEGQEVRIPPVEASTAVKKKAPTYTKQDEAYIRSLIIFDDGDIVALNKPGDIASQGGGGVERHIDGLLSLLEDKKGRRPRLIHRLDRETSGVLLCARKSESVRKLGKSFQDRRAKKIYWALVSPAPEQNEGTINAPVMKPSGPHKDRMIISEEEGSKTAITDFIVLERAGKNAAFVGFLPRTGRTHQLRVHSADVLNCPIIGDFKYGKAEAEFSGMDLSRGGLHLHARRLTLPHPGTGQMLDIIAPLPPGLEESFKLLGFSTNGIDEQLEKES